MSAETYTAAAAATLPSGAISSNQARDVVLALTRDDSLWERSWEDAVDHILAAAIEAIGCDHVSVWANTGDGEMGCLVSRDRNGRTSTDGVMRQDDCPVYFASLRADRVLDADDALTDPRTMELVDSYLVPRGIGALLDATLRQNGRACGVLCCEQLGGPRLWSSAERELIASLADLMSQLRLVGDLRKRQMELINSQNLLSKRNRMLEQVHALSRQVGEGITVKSLVHAAVQVLKSFSGATGVVCYLVDETSGELRLADLAADSISEDLLEELRRLPEVGPRLREVVATERAMVLNDLDTSDALPPHRREVAVKFGLRSGVMVPLLRDRRVTGLYTLWFADRSEFDAEDVVGFETFGQTFSIALSNARYVERLEYRLEHDALTGLANRELLEAEFQRLRTDDARLALLRLDILKFRQINESLGRRVGDELLQYVATRVTDLMQGRRGLAVRLTGDDFVILLGDADDNAALVHARSVRDAVRRPFTIAGLSIELDCEIGIALAPVHGMQLNELLEVAEVAMEWARRQSTAIVLYEPTMVTHGPRDAELLAELHNAIAMDQFDLLFQPRVDMTANMVTGCEALLRWTHPTLGTVPPNRFIPVAEAGDLMRPITLWVAKTALKQIAAFTAAGMTASISINVSTHNLGDADFPAQLDRLRATAKVPAQLLQLEIRESLLMSDPERVSAAIRRLADLGFGIALDGFGMGNSSLALLRSLSLRALKIDQSFVRDLPGNPENELVIRSTLGLAKGIGIELVAEGVEDAATLDRLRQLGCHVAQGFHISRPMGAESYERWAKR